MLEKHSKVQKIFHAFPRFHTLPFEKICLCLEVSMVAVSLFVKSQMGDSVHCSDRGRYRVVSDEAQTKPKWHFEKPKQIFVGNLVENITLALHSCLLWMKI